MSIGAIWNNINYHDGRIDHYYCKKRDIERQLDELERLRDKFTNLQNNFGNRQSQRQRGLSMFLGRTERNKIFNSYYRGMCDLLSGKSFNNAYEGLSEAKSKVNAKIRKLMDDLDSCEQQITYHQNQKSHWQYQLYLAQMEADEEES